jgi:hypothetical protein
VYTLIKYKPKELDGEGDDLGGGMKESERKGEKGR